MASEHPSSTRFRAEHARRGGTGDVVILPDSVHTAALAAEALGCEVVWAAGNHDSRAEMRAELALGAAAAGSTDDVNAADAPITEVLWFGGLRVIVADVPACYAALARVHEAWRAVDGEFDDYIARPKPNGYQSLHTVVLGHDGRPLEVQIRTRAMHEHAEHGAVLAA